MGWSGWAEPAPDPKDCEQIAVQPQRGAAGQQIARPRDRRRPEKVAVARQAELTTRVGLILSAMIVRLLRRLMSPVRGARGVGGRDCLPSGVV
jgi:hypothetical protein